MSADFFGTIFVTQPSTNSPPPHHNHRSTHDGRQKLRRKNRKHLFNFFQPRFSSPPPPTAITAGPSNSRYWIFKRFWEFTHGNIEFASPTITMRAGMKIAAKKIGNVCMTLKKHLTCGRDKSTDIKPLGLAVQPISSGDLQCGRAFWKHNSLKFSKPCIHKPAEWFSNHLRTACKPNACMRWQDYKPALRHLRTVRIPFAENWNLSVFCTNTTRNGCAECPFHAPGILCSPQVRGKLLNHVPLTRLTRTV